MNRLDPDSLIYYWKEPAMPKLKPYADGDQKTAAAFGGTIPGWKAVLSGGQVVARLEPPASWSAMRGLVDELAGGAR